MTKERWQKVQTLFAAAVALDGNERDRLLEAHARADPELVAHARALLRADAQPGVMDVVAAPFPSIARVLADTMPDRIGAYRVIGELGRGGMGVVYLAERADGEFQHQVAIKLIETSDAEDPRHQRFRAERQILAGLVHPNIARLLDGGVTDEGRPYLVMEYVDGVPITRYCDDRRLEVPSRLQLFADVCAAVQHAHQNLVIHRDLKPSNILVSTDGRVHLLDFGIAKLIDPALSAAPSPQTRVESRMMTPEYASPEQVRAEPLTTASDIYSLGVLLYELLCGCRPYRLTTSSPVQIAAAVCEQDPERPSVRATRAAREEGDVPADTAAQLRGTSADRLAQQLRGDLDGIVLMAMRKEPGRRYASADMLRQDVERFLTGLPVLAHRGSRRYRAEKFLRRHRVETAAAAIVVAALITGLSLALTQGRRASRERDRAEQALAESDGVTNFLLALFQTGSPGEAPPDHLSALDLLQRAAARADELADQPVVYARLLDVVGQMSLNLGRLDEAQRRLEQAVAIRRTALGSRSLDLANSLIHLSWVHRTRNDHPAARNLVSEALDIRRSVLPANHPDIADAVYESGWLRSGVEQERLYREALAILSETDGSAERRITLLQGLSTNLRRQGRPAEAVAAGREALNVAERSFGPDHYLTGHAMIHVGDHVWQVEQNAGDAERSYRRGLDLITRQFGDNSIRLIHGLNSLAELMGEQNNAEAEVLSRRALAISRSATGPEHPRVADQLQRLAHELSRQGRLTEAETLARQALDLTIRTVGARHSAVATARLPLLARILDRQQRYEEADRVYASALEQTLPGPIAGEMRRDYGLMLLRRGDYRRAEQQLLQSLSVLELSYRNGPHPNIDESKRALMQLHGRWGKQDAVERYRVPPGRFIPH
jgi:serine/threonine protein kinase